MTEDHPGTVNKLTPCLVRVTEEKRGREEELIDSMDSNLRHVKNSGKIPKQRQAMNIGNQGTSTKGELTMLAKNEMRIKLHN